MGAQNAAVGWAVMLVKRMSSTTPTIRRGDAAVRKALAKVPADRVGLDDMDEHDRAVIERFQQPGFDEPGHHLAGTHIG